MIQVPKDLIAPLIQVLEWNLQTYCTPDYKDKWFSVSINRVLEDLYAHGGANSVETEDKYTKCLRETIENASNYLSECSVSRQNIDELRDWIYAIDK